MNDQKSRKSLIYGCFLLLLGVALWISLSLGFGHRLARSTMHYDQLETELVRNLRNLEPDEVSSLRICSRDGRQLLFQTSDTTVLEAFVLSLQDVVAHQPNHPRYSEKYGVEITFTDGRLLELELGMQTAVQDVFIYFVSKSGTVTVYLGHARSQKLHSWMRQHLKRSRPSREAE